MTTFGILGCGRIGKVHAGTLYRLRGARVVAVADAVAAAAEALAAEVEAEVRSAEAIVAASDIDAVVICTPTDTHADLIEAAAAAGKPVFCEKPIDLDADRVRACLARVDEAGVPLMIGFQRRFDADFRALRAAISEGRIGKLEQVTITSRDPGPPPLDYLRRSGGIFRDMTIHDFDMARFLLDEPIARVLATGSVLVDPAIAGVPDFDTVTVVMESAGGTQVVINNSRRASYGYDQRVEAFGSDGMLSVGNHHEDRLTRAGADGFHGAALENFFMTRYAAAYAEELRAFMDVVENGGDPPVGGVDGLEALRLADAATDSAGRGGWVAL